MAFNEPSRESSTRAPRAICKLNDQEIEGVVAFTIDQNTAYQANEIRLTLAVQAAEGLISWPAWSTLGLNRAIDPYDAKSLNLEAEQQLVEIEVSLDAGTGLRVLFTGVVDEFDFDPAAGTVALRGRDKTSLLLERKTSDKFQSLTGSEVIRLLVERVDPEGTIDLTAVQDDEVEVGTLIDDQQVSLTTSRSYWDFCAWIAQSRNYLLYFDGNKLVYRPDPAALDDGATDSPATYELTFDRSSPRHPWSNALAVTFRRSMTVSRDVFVDVRSHSLFEGSSRKTARAFLGKRPATRGGTAQVYSYLLEDATEEEAQLFAERMLRRITATQISMNARIPGDARVDAATRVVVTGTNSSFDQDFYIDHLIHRFGAQRGYEVEIQAKNHLTQSTVQG